MPVLNSRSPVLNVIRPMDAFLIFNPAKQGILLRETAPHTCLWTTFQVVWKSEFQFQRKREEFLSFWKIKDL